MEGYGQETDGERIAASTSFVLPSGGWNLSAELYPDVDAALEQAPDHLDGAHRPNPGVLA